MLLGIFQTFRVLFAFALFLPAALLQAKTRQKLSKNKEKNRKKLKEKAQQSCASGIFHISTTRLSLSMVQDSAASFLCKHIPYFYFTSLPTTPTEFCVTKYGFRLFPVRSPLLRESLLLYFPPATKMFQFTGLSLSNLWIPLEVLQVALFGDLRIKACCQLLEAFRRYLRPSSSLSA